MKTLTQFLLFTLVGIGLLACGERQAGEGNRAETTTANETMAAHEHDGNEHAHDGDEDHSHAATETEAFYGDAAESAEEPSEVIVAPADSHEHAGDDHHHADGDNHHHDDTGDDHHHEDGGDDHRH